MKLIKSIVVICLLALLTDSLQAQVSSNSLRRALSLSDKSSFSSKKLLEAKEFYEINGYRHRWLSPGGKGLEDLKVLLDMLPASGLNRADYLDSFPAGLASETDSVQAEINITLALLGIVHDLLYGNAPPPVLYDGWKTASSPDSTVFLLNDYLQKERLSFLIQELAPQWTVYESAVSYLRKLNRFVSRNNFKDIIVPVVRGHADSSLLRMRIDQLAVTDTSYSSLIDLVKSAQVLFDIFPDGYAGTITLQALHVPLRKRIENISETLNTLRWLYRRLPSVTGITVNIPSANLYYLESGRVSFESRIIPGKPSTQTPTLSSFVQDVVLYPYWHVPYSIATRELLPLIKKNPGFINAGNYQLLDNKGKIVSPASVKWATINARNFPYVLRQSTGCDNALGWIKLNFDNPFSVYLHDTPGKLLFNLRRRFFSHGCMRVEKAAELARNVLPGNTAMLDSLEKLGPLKNISPISIKLPKPVAVVVLYQSAWFDSAGNVRFYEDIYRKGQASRR